jgi:ferredoxin-type protein NapG
MKDQNDKSVGDEPIGESAASQPASDGGFNSHAHARPASDESVARQADGRHDIGPNDDSGTLPPDTSPEDEALQHAGQSPIPPGPQTSTPSPSADDASESRRGFFARCMRDLMAPLASLIESKVEPMTSAFQTDFGHDASPMYSDAEHYDRYDRYSTPDVILRPPGALPDEDFEKACSKCGLCVQACPVKCIVIDAEARIGDGFPYILPALAPCVVCDELACMKACPTGALKLVEKAKIRMGLAVVDAGTCLRSHGEDCRLCVEACPIGDTAISISQTSGRVLVKTNGCVGCGSCEHACPTDPAAVTIRPIKTHAFPNED